MYPQDSAMKLRLFRVAKGMTQIEFAAKIGLSPGYYTKIESRIKPVSEPLLEKIREVFGSDPMEGRQPPLEPAAVMEPRLVYGSKKEELPENWQQILSESAASKARVVEIGVREYSLPIREAMRPVLDEFDRRCRR